MQIYSFDDLTFTQVTIHAPKRAKIFFPNGYGASVVYGYGTYGYEKGLYELTVIKGNSMDNWELCYDTKITDDVLGNLSKEDVTNLLNKIASL